MSLVISNRVFWSVLIAAAALATCLSLLIGLQQSVWFDEAYSILLAEHSWGEIIRLTAADVHPPVYYWLLKAWMMLFGSSELALRSMSVLSLGASICMAGLLLRRMFGAKTALLALPFLVFAPFLLRYGFEIRMYALCSLIGIGATYLLVAAIEEKEKRRRLLLFFAYGLLVALGVYTLYFMALVWIAHLAWLLWLTYHERRADIIKPGLTAYALAMLLFLPWLPIFLGKAGGGTLSAVTTRLGIENLFGIMTFSFLYRPSWEVILFTVAAVVSVLGIVVYLAKYAYKTASQKERGYLILLLAYFMAPILVLVVVTHIKPIFLERYTAHFAIGMYASVGVVVALSLQKGRSLVRVTTAGTLVALLLIGCISLSRYGNYNFQRVHTPSVKQASTLLTGCKNDAVIFADGPQLAMELMYYVKDCPVYFFNETLEMGGGFAMLSGSSLRVAGASELPSAKKILYLYYNQPKQKMPVGFYQERVTTHEKLSVAVYQASAE